MSRFRAAVRCYAHRNSQFPAAVEDGFFEKNARGVYSVNNVTAKPNADGSVTVQFGGQPDGAAPNCIPTSPGWNYLVRMYRPRKEILDGTWKFPAAQPLS